MDIKIYQIIFDLDKNFVILFLLKITSKNKTLFNSRRMNTIRYVNARLEAIAMIHDKGNLSPLLWPFVPMSTDLVIDSLSAKFNLDFYSYKQNPAVPHYEEPEYYEPPDWDMASPEELGQRYPNEGY